jgi:hypothetical protein
VNVLSTKGEFGMRRGRENGLFVRFDDVMGMEGGVRVDVIVCGLI